MKPAESHLPVSRRSALAMGGATLGGLALSGTALGMNHDDDGEGDENDHDEADRHYRVTVANLTNGQPFTPPAVALHRPSVDLFSVGEPASEEIQQVAENGNLDPLVDLVSGTEAVRAAAVGQSPLVPNADPGDTGNPYYETLHLSADTSATHLTFVSMLIATNDGFVGLDTVPLPDAVNASQTYYANGYDAGTERNTERYEDLVPPAQTLIEGGEATGGTDESDPALAENGVIHPHAGIRGEGDLSVDDYGWQEPAALVQVERVDGLQQEFSATLTGASEVPPVETSATGEAMLSLSSSGNELAYSLAATDIENVVAAHIHCGRAGTNGPVGVTLYADEAISPDGTFAEGEITEPDADNGCGWDDLAAVVDALRSGRAYVNVHTEANMGGEIRGQVR